MRKRILNTLKLEMLSEQRTTCGECIANTIPAKKAVMIEVDNDMSPCFYRFCIILEYYFNIKPIEIVKIYEKYGKAKELISCKNSESKKNIQQEVYNLCLKRININKI